MARSGFGFFIWRWDEVVKRYPTPASLIPLLREHGVRWISIKLAHYIYPDMVIGGNDQFNKAYFAALRAAGIQVGGWHYIYPEKAGAQGDLAIERYQKLELDFWDIDAEAEWNNIIGGSKAAKVYLSKLHGGRFENSLCSYRYPEYFPTFPWGAFLTSAVAQDKVKVIAQQLYWLFDNRPEAPAIQLAESKTQYIPYRVGRPYVPVGCAFGGESWCPTVEQLENFLETCENDPSIPAWGLYSLDFMLRFPQYAATWWDVLKVDVPPPPPPDPEPPPDDIQAGDVVKVAVSEPYKNLYTHSSPDTLVSTRNGYLPNGLIVKVTGISLIDGKLWLESNGSWFAGWLVEKV